MAYTRTISLTSVNWTSEDFSYLNSSRNFFDTFFYTNTSLTNFVNGVSGIQDVILQNNSLLILTKPIIINVSNVFPSNYQESLSSSSYSDFSMSNYVLTSQPTSSQNIIHIPLENNGKIFNVFSLPLDNDLYYKIHANSSDDQIVLSKKCDYIDTTFDPDKINTFVLEITSKFSDFLNCSLQGETPCESDQISSKNEVYWLSGNPISHKWVKTFQINNVLSSISVDTLPVSGIFEYNRLGDIRNSMNRKNIESRLMIDDYTNLPKEVSTEFVNTNINWFNLNGTEYLKINWNDPEYTYEKELKNNISFSCLFKNSDKGGQIIGNRNIDKTSGFSFQYNTGFQSFIKTVPFEDFLYTFNTDNLKNYEKQFVDSNLSLIACGPEGSGVRWIYDSNNKEIHKVDIDNISLTKIVLKKNAEITHIESDYQNNLWVMDIHNKVFSSYDLNGNMRKNVSFSSFGIVKKWDMFYIPILGHTPIPTFAKVTDFDSQGNLYRVMGNNIRKNSSLFYSFKEEVQDLYVDVKDRVWVYFGKNKLIIIDSNTGLKLREISVILSISSERNARISGWNDNGIYSTQILLLDNNMIIEIDENLNIIKKTDINVSCKRNYPFTFRGDWTGYKMAKRQNYYSGKFASIDYPLLTLDFSYNCVQDRNDPVQHGIFRKHVDYRKNSKFDDWNGIGFVINNSLGELNIFINGSSVLHESFVPMSKILRHEYPDNNRYNPILMGAFNGKIGTVSSHTGKINQNLKGKIGTLAIYSNALTKGNMLTIFKDDYYRVTNRSLFKPLKVKIPSNTQHHIVKLNKFLKNGIPGIQSNFFDINVYGFSGTESDKNKLEYKMKQEIENVIPAHVGLRKIFWK